MLSHMLRGSLSRATVTYIGNTSNNTDASSYTFNSVNIGGPGLIVIAVHGSSTTTANRNLTSLTVNGNSATLVSNTASYDFAFLTSYRVTSGTTANIVVNFNNTVSRCLIAVYRIQNNRSDTEMTSTQSWLTTNRSSANITLSPLSTGVTVLGVSSSSGSATFTWTNATEQFDTQIEANTSASGAINNLSAASKTITATCSTSSRLYLSGAVWQ